MAKLMTGVSGVRGVIGEGLSPDVISRYGAAFGTFIGGGTIVVGSDARPSRKMVRSALFAGLMSAGCKVIDLGMATTPTIEMMVEKLSANGGICVTASHNPISWNALKFLDSRGRFLDLEQGREVNRIFREDSIQYVETGQLGEVTEVTGSVDYHIRKILEHPLIDIAAIRRAQFRVAIDCVNSVGNLIMPNLLHELGCDVVKINSDVSGNFARIAEPLPENLSDLGQLIVDEGADIGFALDPDGDRLAIVDEQGHPIGEEYTLALVTKFILERTPGPVVCNLSTSRVIDDLATSYQVECFRTPVGEAHVAKKMDEVKAVIGGEGNGGVMLPCVHTGRDAMVGTALVLSLLAAKSEPLSYIFSRLPQYVIIKRRLNAEGIDLANLLQSLEQHFGERGKYNTTDGVRVDVKEGWVHVRPSNTEPIIRLYCEAATADDAEKLAEETMSIFR